MLLFDPTQHEQKIVKFLELAKQTLLLLFTCF